VQKPVGIITLASGKGGSGKTTSAAGLAGAFAKMGIPPDGVLDVDYGTSLTQVYGYEPAMPTVQALLDGQIDFEDAVNETAEGNFLIPTTIELTAVPASRMQAWRTRLRELAATRFLIIDTSDQILSAPVSAAILACDVLAIPLMLNRKNFKRTYPEIKALLTQWNHTPQERWFATSVDPRTTVYREVLAEVSAAGHELVAQIPRGIAADEADHQFQSVVGYAPRSKVAKAYEDLAHVLYAALQRSRGVTGAESGAKRMPRSLDGSSARATA